MVSHPRPFVSHQIQDSQVPIPRSPFLLASISILPLLMGLVIGVQLITAIVYISAICFVVRVVLISPVINLLRCVRFSRYFFLFHSITPF